MVLVNLVDKGDFGSFACVEKNRFCHFIIFIEYKWGQESVVTN